MSNETDLDWLARNVHVWGGLCNYATLCNGSCYFHQYRPSNVHSFTRAEWLARRAELQEKPSWETHEYKVIAQGRNGSWYGSNYSEEKFGHENSFCITGTGWNCICRGVDLGDWRDTLEKRPEELKPSIEEANRLAQEFKPFTSIEDNQEQEMKQDNKWFDRGELPPVGVWCEASGDGASPEKCKIIAYHKGQVALQWEVFNGGCLDILELNGEYWKFSHIRTEREALIEIIAGNLSGTTGIVADAIIAAGFKLGGK